MKEGKENAEGITEEILLKHEKLESSLKKKGRVLIAFSGGVDSTFLLNTAHDTLGNRVLAVIVNSEIFPEKEIKGALKFVEKKKIPYEIIQLNIMKKSNFVKNTPRRCYLCKKEFFTLLRTIAAKVDIPFVLDGENFDDKFDLRPGIKAAEELGIYSPLKEVKLRKNEIRKLSKKKGLFTWNKPSSSCLATRIPYNMRIDRKILRQIEKAEEVLKASGFSQIRVRHYGKTARIEIEPDEFSEIIEKDVRSKVIKGLKKVGYTYITLDLAGFRSGSMNENLKDGK